MKNWWINPGWDDRDINGISPPSHIHRGECCLGVAEGSSGKWCEKCLKRGMYSWLAYHRAYGTEEGFFSDCPECRKREAQVK